MSPISGRKKPTTVQSHGLRFFCAACRLQMIATPAGITSHKKFVAAKGKAIDPFSSPLVVHATLN